MRSLRPMQSRIFDRIFWTEYYSILDFEIYTEEPIYQCLNYET